MKIAALMMLVDCHCKGKCHLGVVKTKNLVTILGSSWCLCCTEFLRSLGVQRPWCDCPEWGHYPRQEPQVSAPGPPQHLGPSAARAWLSPGTDGDESLSVTAQSILPISLPARAELPQGAASALHRRDTTQAHYWKIVLFNIANWEVC